MKRRLDMQSKAIAVMGMLCDNYQPMTAYVIGKALGYTNGQPVQRPLEWLHSHGFVEYHEVVNNFGTKGYMWRLTPAGRAACQEHGFGVSSLTG